MVEELLQTKIKRQFRLHGLSLRKDGTTFLQSLLREFKLGDVEEALSRIIETLCNADLPSPIVDMAALERAVQECKDGDPDCEKVLNVINSFEIPRYHYQAERKKLCLDTAPNTLFGGAPKKIGICKERYSMILQRTQRHSLFTQPVAGALQDTKKFVLHTVEQVLGQQGVKQTICVLAMITQIEEGKFFLEDSSCHMQCDLSKARFHQGLFMEFTFVLAEGIYDEIDNIFKVSGIGLPPPEPAKITRNYFGNANFFGGSSTVAVGAVAKLRELEKERDSMIVIMSDVWLDQPQVMTKLKTMFSGYSKFPPFAFVLFGNFLSAYNPQNTMEKMKTGFKALADLLALFPVLCADTHFLLVPGPQDPGPAPVFPRPSIPATLAGPLSNRLSNLHLCTNPARLQYCSQEIVLFRENLVNKFCRNSIVVPSRDKELHVHLAKTILSQGHLAPLPLHVTPIHWSYDHALRLYPIPDMVVVADRYDAFSVTVSECLVVNPGSFSKNNFNFKVYLPAQRKLENCEISI